MIRFAADQTYSVPPATAIGTATAEVSDTPIRPTPVNTTAPAAPAAALLPTLRAPSERASALVFRPPLNRITCSTAATGSSINAPAAAPRVAATAVERPAWTSPSLKLTNRMRTTSHCLMSRPPRLRFHRDPFEQDVLDIARLVRMEAPGLDVADVPILEERSHMLRDRLHAPRNTVVEIPGVQTSRTTSRRKTLHHVSGQAGHAKRRPGEARA